MKAHKLKERKANTQHDKCMTEFKKKKKNPLKPVCRVMAGDRQKFK